MAEEKKECCQGSGAMKTLLKIVVGIVLIGAGILLGIRWLMPLRILVQGCIPPFLVLVGLVFIAIAKE